MYVEKKIINGKSYYYLKSSVRYKDKVKTITIAYLGKGDMSKVEIKKAIARIPSNIVKKKIKDAIERLKSTTIKITKQFLDEDKLKRLKHIKVDFKRKVHNKKIKQDMFNDFATYFVFNTNAIEGNTLTLRETDLLLSKGITPQGKTLREINDQINSKECFEFILQEEPKIDHKTIIKIHSILLKNIDRRIGYRKHNVRVFGAKFETAPAKFVLTDMNLLLRWYRKQKSEMHPLILAAAFHHKFEKVHPFYDGNGRTGRMLLNLILLKNGFPPLIISDKQRKRYYNALEKADKADFSAIDKNYESIINFCYLSLIKTYNTIFSRWG